jgi:hypothetical protein
MERILKEEVMAYYKFYPNFLERSKEINEKIQSGSAVSRVRFELTVS